MNSVSPRPLSPQVSAQGTGQKNSPKTPPIFCTELQPINGQGNLRAFASIQIGSGPNSFEVADCRLIDTQDGRRPFVSLPQRSWEDPTTKQRKYAHIVKVPRHWQDVITDVVLGWWERYQQNGELPQGAGAAR